VWWVPAPHIAYCRHAEIKKKWLAEALFGAFDGEIDFVSPDDIFFWRRKITSMLLSVVENGPWLFWLG